METSTLRWEHERTGQKRTRPIAPVGYAAPSVHARPPRPLCSPEPLTTVFYGWKIVAVCFLTLFVSIGFGFYSFGAFFKEIAAELGGSRFGVGAGLAIFFATNGLVAPFLGRAIDRGSIRSIMSVGVLLLAAGFVVVSRAQSLWQFYLALGSLMAFGAALIGGLTASTLVSNWFVRRRGMALGIATMGISLSGVVMAPTATLLIGRFGWRSTFVLYAVLTVVLVLPAVRLLVVNQPEDLGLAPDGDSDPTIDRSGQTGIFRRASVELQAAGTTYVTAAGALDWRTAMRGRAFWLIAIVVGLNFCANGSILTHIIPHVTDLGYGPARASLVLSTMAALGVLGKVLFGWVADRFDVRYAMFLSSMLQAAGVAALLSVDGYPGLVAVGAVFGLGMGGLVPLWGSMIGAVFGRRAFGRVMGLMSPMILPLQVSGVPFAGWVYDTTGRYQPAFVLYVVMYALSMVLVTLMRLPEHEPADGGYR